MRTLEVLEHISLDGVIHLPPDEAGFPYGDWTEPYRSPEGRDAVLAAHAEPFDLVLGRRTYDIWSGHWPKALSGPIADAINRAMKHVATHRPETLEWGPVASLGSDVVEGVRRLKAQDGPRLLLWGSSTLTSALLEHGLVDTILLFQYPVLLGTGKRFFAEGTPARSLQLVRSTAMPSGFVVNTYTVDRTLKTA